MKRTIEIVIYICAGLSLLFYMAELRAEDKIISTNSGNDTYNFYFQKAPGPTTVNQGVATPAAAVPPTTTPAATQAATDPNTLVIRKPSWFLPDDVKFLTLSPEYVSMDSAVGSSQGWGASLILRPIRYLALQVGIQKMRNPSDPKTYAYVKNVPDPEQDFAPRRTIQQISYHEKENWNIGLLLLPLSFALSKDSSVDLGAGVGRLWAQIEQNGRDNVPVLAQGGIYNTAPDIHKRGIMYYGPYAALNITPNFGINAQMKISERSAVKQFSTGISIRL